jgi:hypothetical protein
MEGFRKEHNNYRRHNNLIHVTDQEEGNLWIHDQYYSKIITKELIDTVPLDEE